MTYLFETNHAVAHLNADPRLAPRLAAAETPGETFVISTIVLVELYYGAHASRRASDNLAKLTSFVAQSIVLDFCTAAATEFGK